MEEMGVQNHCFQRWVGEFGLGVSCWRMLRGRPWDRWAACTFAGRLPSLWERELLLLRRAVLDPGLGWDEPGHEAMGCRCCGACWTAEMP